MKQTLCRPRKPKEPEICDREPDERLETYDDVVDGRHQLRDCHKNLLAWARNGPCVASRPSQNGPSAVPLPRVLPRPFLPPANAGTAAPPASGRAIRTEGRNASVNFPRKGRSRR